MSRRHAQKLRLPSDLLLVLLPCLVWLLLPSLGRATASAIRSESVAAAGQQREIAPGEEHAWSLVPDPHRATLLVIEQHCVDVTVDVVGPDGVLLVATDSPFDRRGEELVLIEAGEAGPLTIAIHAREAGAPTGRYTIRREQMDAGAEGMVALRAMTEAAGLYRAGTHDAWRAGIVAYQVARRNFAVADQARHGAICAYAAAVLLRLIDEATPALETAEAALAAWREQGDRAWEANTWNEIGLDRWALGEIASARTAFHTALGLFEEAADAYGEGTARANLCLMHLVAGELRAGLVCYEQALPILAAVQATELEAAALTSVGRAWDVIGEPGRARQSYRRALVAMARAGNQRGEAQVQNNLGALLQQRGDLDGALGAYDRALTTFRQLEDRRWQARVLGNLGRTYSEFGEPRRAVTFLEQALAGWRAVGDVRGETQTLSNLGRAHAVLGEIETGARFHRQALERARRLEDPRAEGIALYELGRVVARQDEPEQALPLFAEALDRLAAAEVGRSRIRVLLERGGLWLRLDDPGSARRDLEQALSTARTLGDDAAEAQAHELLARTARARGDLETARIHAELAVAAIEGARTRIAHPDRRAAYASMQPRAYDLLVDLLMTAHQTAPNAGHDRRAFEVREQGRARGLVELLTETRTDGGHALANEHHDLLERLSARAELRSGGDTERETQRVEQAEILRRLDVVEAEIRRQDPAWSALTRPEPTTAAAIQRVLDRESHTLLLAYHLGEYRSVLWAVTAKTFTSFELPPRAAIEAMARDLHPRLADGDPRQRAAETATMVALGEMLLGPVADRLGTQPLAIVPDGALHFLPWSALPVPDRSVSGSDTGRAPTLVDGHAIVVLPSARVLVALRQPGRPRATTKRIALLADPVFDSGDQGNADFGPLPWSRTEAETIASLVPAEQRWLALGADASRQAVLGDGLVEFQTVHFATHGVLDAEYPALSGLVLSRDDQADQPSYGFLPLAEIYGLRLNADLVVLSGCQTALGREIRSEGLVGLTRGFLYAGASRVVASLWRVEDRATAELMSRFYRAMWSEGLSAAEALRVAQRHVRDQRRWRDPYYWAGWILVGEVR